MGKIGRQKLLVHDDVRVSFRRGYVLRLKIGQASGQARIDFGRFVHCSFHGLCACHGSNLMNQKILFTDPKRRRSSFYSPPLFPRGRTWVCGAD